MSYKIEITGFKTQTQAEAFVRWYEGEGEQNIGEWVDTSMNVDIEKTYPLTWNDKTLKMCLSIE